jgi:Flp pilus assembly pilin Flp
MKGIKMDWWTSSRKVETQSGQGVVEYALLLALVALAALLALTSVGEQIVKSLQALNWGGDEAGEASTLVVTVLDAGREGIGGVRVFVYSEQGDYLEMYADTDSNGNVLFEMENGRYQFLAQHQLHYFWSDVAAYPEQSLVEIQTGQAPFKVIVQDMAGNGVADIPVYAYTEEGEYMGVTGQTDENGILVMELIDADVQFRVDADNKTQWSDVVPTSQDEIIITLNPCGTNQYLAEYFDNRYLDGEPVISRCEEAINYSWGAGSPGDGVDSNNFSARWTGQVQFDASSYVFRTTADDGVRFWLDGEMMTDAWKPQSETTYASRKSLKAGNHEIKVEYFEAYGNATAKLSWEPMIDSCPTGQFLAEYYNNRNLSGDPAVVRCETAVNYDWGSGSPVTGINSDSFSVRWSGTFKFAQGNYAVRTTADDGVRLWFDDKLVIDAWVPQTAQTYAYRPSLNAGEHKIKMEYYEQGGLAVAWLNWEESVISCPTGQFLAEYFNNRYLNGSPVVARCENSISYDWGKNSPAEGVTTDNFSIRWQGRFKFAEGETTFTTTTDDGVQLFVDGTMVISAWVAQNSVTHTAKTELSAGEHEITVNYYESSGDAEAKVKWE